jgi:twitching motility protein PilT
VVTIEDPVEFVYTDKKCTINQRQLGNDVKSLNEALRRVLRQDPDVILMGEMRDRETMELAMHAAETGHLVFSTLHTNDAKQTIDRIIDAFPPDAHPQVRAQLALTLHAVVGQRLVRKPDGSGRVAAVEVMIASPQIRELIGEGKTSAIEKAIASSGEYYQMQTFNQSLARLAQEGAITQDDALAASTTPGDLRLMLRGFSTGQTTTMATKAAPAPVAAPAAAGAGGGFRITRGY